MSGLYFAVSALLFDQAERTTGWNRWSAAILAVLMGLTGLAKFLLWLTGAGE